MTRRERIAIWVLVSLTVLGLIVNTIVLAGEIAELRRQVAYAVGARPTPEAAEEASEQPPAVPEPEENVGDAEVWGSHLHIRALGARHVGHTTVVSLTVRGSGAADPLMDLPLLLCAGQPYDVEGVSLEQARRDLLALITQGRATTALRFLGTPNLMRACVVLLNPAQTGDSPIAPRIEVPLPRQAPAAAVEKTEGGD